jgi:molybdopterin biosynthesis enzyme
MISVAEAIQIVAAQPRPLERGRIFLADALGRILAENVIANIDLPTLSSLTLREIRAH